MACTRIGRGENKTTVCQKIQSDPNGGVTNGHEEEKPFFLLLSNRSAMKRMWMCVCWKWRKLETKAAEAEIMINLSGKKTGGNKTRIILHAN